MDTRPAQIQESQLDTKGRNDTEIDHAIIMYTIVVACMFNDCFCQSSSRINCNAILTQAHTSCPRCISTSTLQIKELLALIELWSQIQGQKNGQDKAKKEGLGDEYWMDKALLRKQDNAKKEGLGDEYWMDKALLRKQDNAKKEGLVDEHWMDKALLRKQDKAKKEGLGDEYWMDKELLALLQNIRS